MFNIKRTKLNLFIVLTLLVIIPFISLGFSALTTVLNIEGDLTVGITPEPIVGSYLKSLNNTYLSSQYKDKIKYISLENRIKLCTVENEFFSEIIYQMYLYTQVDSTMKFYPKAELIDIIEFILVYKSIAL